MLRFIKLLVLFMVVFQSGHAQKFDRRDSLRGTLNLDRSWWNVQQYNICIEPDLTEKTLKGSVSIRYKTASLRNTMQLDLQEPMKIDSVIYHGQVCIFTRTENAFLVKLPTVNDLKLIDSILVYFSGTPRAARMPPWDGGISWKKDEKGRPWIGVSCQGLGASVWWPNKDHQSDEPEQGISISVITPDSLVNISNGQLVSTETARGKTKWTYRVKNPINNYDITMNIGKYYTEQDSFSGSKGPLKINYCVLDYNKGLPLSHLKKETHRMLRCFEYWFGPYPFYEDGYKIVESPYLGMEHQSCIAYGNKFRNGYLGSDRSRTGIGLLWDFIVIHESGHEWFGNNITSKDIADMWIHEGFTTYSEALFIECMFNKDSAEKYIRGLRRNISNDRTMIGNYGVNHEGSGDIYDKGANMIHNIRLIINNDSIFRLMLRGLQSTYGKTTVKTEEIEYYISTFTGKNLQPVFDQYLRTTQIPEIEVQKKGNKIEYRWTECIEGFDMPITIEVNGRRVLLQPNTKWQSMSFKEKIRKIKVSDSYYVRSKIKK